MPKPKKGPRLGGSPAHQRLMLSNLATALFEHGRITTTETRARLLRPVAEKLITKAKRGDLHNRREVLKTVRDKSVVHTLFTEIAPTFSERPGGYTRITKIGPRKGDNAPMAVIELVTEAYSPKAPSTKKTEAAAAPAPAAESGLGRGRRGRGVDGDRGRRDRGCRASETAESPGRRATPPRSTPRTSRQGLTPRCAHREARQAAGWRALRRRAAGRSAGSEARRWRLLAPQREGASERAPGARRRRGCGRGRRRGRRARVAATTASLTGVGTPSSRP